MKSEKKKSGGFYLKWPWSLLVYILLVILLRIWSIPFILLIMHWNKKRQPNGPEEGYCLQRTRQRLTGLVWAALFLAIGVVGIVAFVGLVGQDKSRWEISDYVLLVGSPLIGLGGVLAALYEGYSGVRDALFPEKSRLAKSIRSQLPYPDEAPDVRELFAMVDQDIRENGQWFDRVAVGKEWVLGDDVTAISRIRAVFGRDEVTRHYSNGRTRHTRVVELHIIDDRRQTQQTSLLNNANELQPLLSCLKLRAPAALFLPYSQYWDYCGKSEEEWAELEREFQMRKRRLEADAAPAAGPAQNMVLTRGDGSVTSRITPELLRQTLLDCLRMGGVQVFLLTPSQPVEAQGHALCQLQCVTTFEKGTEEPSDGDLAALGTVDLLLKVAPERPGDPPEHGFALHTNVRQGEEILRAWLRGEAPDLRSWSQVQLRTIRQPQPRQQDQDPIKLTLTERTGATRSYTTITRRDVELAGDGLVSGKYTTVVLSMGAQYIYIQSGGKEDGRATVQASRADPDELRLFEIKCRERQARDWLLELADGRFAPDFSQWKDITKKIQKELQKTSRS